MIEKELKESNKKLAGNLNKYRITSLYLTSIGNSIASGYSMTRITKPLLFRNSTILPIMQEQGIDTKLTHFARAQNNSDEHILDWFLNNIELSEIYNINISDYNVMKLQVKLGDIIKYYTANDFNLRLSDLILEHNPSLANIVIYNGATGSFLDNITKEGHRYFTYGVKRDCISIEAILKYIQNANRIKKSNTQVYLCGVPNLLGLNISDIINNRLKKIAKQYANVTYVEPAKSKLFYRTFDNKISFDLHYDETEYLKLSNNIIESIAENYLLKKILIEIDRDLYFLSQMIEINQDNAYQNSFFLSEFVDNILNFYHLELIKENQNVNELKSKIYQYIKKRYIHDFYFINKKIKVLKKHKNS
ncbi:MAG: hypothetical protein RR404_00530 [Bacilli bacterium]